MKTCIFDENKECNNCGECRCELDPNKVCDNCFRCLDKDQRPYASIEITDVITDARDPETKLREDETSVVWNLNRKRPEILFSTLDRPLRIVRIYRRGRE